MEGGRRETLRRLALLMAATAALKLFFVWRYPGFLTGDDLEPVETAGRHAIGLRYQPWDIRSLFHSLVFVWPAVKAAALAGARDPRAITQAAALPAVGFSTWAVGLVYALARRFEASRPAAGAAAALYAFHFLPLAFGSTAYPRPVSTALLALAFVVVSGPAPTARAAWAAGALAGSAFAVRWSEGVVLLPLLASSAWRHPGRGVWLRVLAGFAVSTSLFVGAVDWATWGRPFASLWAFFRTMYLEIPGSRLAGEKPFPYYGWSVLNWAGPVAILLLLGSWRDRRARRAIAIFSGVVLLMSLFAHKEWRYLQAAIPFLCVGAAFAWERLRVRFGPAAAGAVLLLGCAWGVERANALLAKKSQPALAAARWIAALRPQPRVVALEQTWAYGNRLYLGNDVAIREIEWQKPLTRLAMREAARDADLLGVYEEHLSEPAREELARLRFVEAGRFRKDAGRECVVYRRAAPAGAPAARPR